MPTKVKSLNIPNFIKFIVTTLFFVDFIRRTFKNVIEINSFSLLITIGLISLLAVVGLKNEFQRIQLESKTSLKQVSVGEKLKIIFTFTLASISTYLIAYLMNINSTFAATIVVLSMVFLIPEPFASFQATVYTGIFTGIVSDQFISNWPLALVFGLIGSLFYISFQPSYRGIGGRAGLNAYMTSFLFILLFSDVVTTVGSPLDKALILPSFLFLIGGSFSTYLLREKTSLSGIQAAMLITLILNILIPTDLSALINAGFMGSFMGTTSPKRISNLSFLFLVELFTFFIFISSYPLITGLAGKLGTVTLIGYLAADGTVSLYKYLKK